MPATAFARIPTAALLAGALAVAALTATVGGCRNPKPNTEQEAVPDKPSVRLYLLSTVAGALEPCGCSKDQLGGVDHLASFIASEKAKAPNHLVLASGPLLFIDEKLKKDHATQDEWKADAIAKAMKDIDLQAWAPGFNDWASGPKTLAAKAKTAGASVLAAGLKQPFTEDSKIFTVGEVKVGVIGVSDPKDRFGRYPDGVSGPDATKKLVEGELAKLREGGAQLVVVLAAMQRGAALRLADGIDGINVLAVGKPSFDGHGNTAQPAPEMIKNTLVVETANHLQTVSVVDVYFRGEPKAPVKLADGSGVERAAKIADLSGRIRELEARINSWEQGGKVDPKDLAARKADLAKLRKEREALEAKQSTPDGSFFRYRVQEVREALGESKPVTALMRDYYKRVNDHNKKAFADLKPLEAADGQAKYVGTEECSNCHMEAEEVWDATPHSNAYETLEKDFKEYNLECVGCHVTGYGNPGGSTVTFVDGLKDVQCETCHGPGSKHVEEPEAPGLITLEPDPKSCVEQCHHPPHVEGFDPVAKMDLVLGPGHGKPLED
ncbi:MAG: multiheme c-type cytochrome [Polyangiaceae bacterium]